MRKCGDCQLCCKLLPIADMDKPANQRCCNQRHGVGCKIYAQRPFSCRVWSCRWLTNDDAAELRRPDRAHYVIDLMPEFIRFRYDDTGVEHQIPVVQIWCDPKYPNAHEDPQLRAWLNRRGSDGYAAIIRYSSHDAFALFPPSMSDDGQWHAKNGNLEREHSVAEIANALGRISIEVSNA